MCYCEYVGVHLDCVRRVRDTVRFGCFVFRRSTSEGLVRLLCSRVYVRDGGWYEYFIWFNWVLLSHVCDVGHARVWFDRSFDTTTAIITAADNSKSVYRSSG